MVRPSAAQSEIQTLVETFTTELTQLVRRSALQQLQDALGGFTASGSTASATRTVRVVRMGKSARKGAMGGKRSTEEVQQFGEMLLVFIKKNPGQRGEQIAQALKTDVKTMRLPILRLIEEKKVKTKGQRRGMTYYPA